MNSNNMTNVTKVIMWEETPTGHNPIVSIDCVTDQYISKIIQYWANMPNCDLITKQTKTEEILWKRTEYKEVTP